MVINLATDMKSKYIDIFKISHFCILLIQINSEHTRNAWWKIACASSCKAAGDEINHVYSQQLQLSIFASSKHTHSQQTQRFWCVFIYLHCIQPFAVASNIKIKWLAFDANALAGYKALRHLFIFQYISIYTHHRSHFNVFKWIAVADSNLYLRWLTFSFVCVRSRRRGSRGSGRKVGASTLQRHLHRSWQSLHGALVQRGLWDSNLQVGWISISILILDFC